MPAEASFADNFAGTWYTYVCWKGIVDISVSGTKISGVPRGDGPSFAAQQVGSRMVGTWSWPSYTQNTPSTPGKIEMSIITMNAEYTSWHAYLLNTNDVLIAEWSGVNVKPSWWDETSTPVTSKALHVEIDTDETQQRCVFTATVTYKETGAPVPNASLEIVVTDDRTGETQWAYQTTTDANGQYSWTRTWNPRDAGKMFLVEVTVSHDGYTSDDTSVYVTAPGVESITICSSTSITTPTVALYSVFMRDSNDAWAVGTNGWIINWDGSKWTLVSSPTDNSRGNTLYSVFMVTLEDVWAVGSDGWIIHWDGSSWGNVESPTRDTLMSIYMLSQNDGWAVGHFGTIIHWDGTSWSNVDSPTKQRLKSVSVSHSGTEAFAVGDEGTIIHWTSRTNTWQLELEEVMVPYPREWLNSVCMLDTNDVWAVGDLGTIIHYDGQNWSKVTSPTVNNLNSIFMVSSFEGIAVGDHGTTIYRHGESWISFDSSLQANLFSVSIEMVTGTNGLTVGEAGEALLLDLQPSYYQPGQTATTMQKVLYTATTLSAPVATVQNNPATGYLSGAYLPAVVTLIAVIASALLLGRRYVTKKKNKP